jgi:hypothetical protein
MAHFAEIDADNIVLRVLVVHNDDEHRGQEFLADDLGLGGTWVQCSYNTRGGVHRNPDGNPDGGTAVRYNYAGVGFTYDPVGDAFYAPSPYPSWVLDENYVWQSPTPCPEGSFAFLEWDEDSLSWVYQTIADAQAEYEALWVSRYATYPGDIEADPSTHYWDEDINGWVEAE